MTIAIIVQNKYPFYPFETKCQLLSLPFSVGNLNEGILLANLLNASKEDDGRRTLFSMSSIYRPGMVEKKNAPYAKTTIDGIGCADIYGMRQLVGIEVKTRVTHGRRQEEVIRRQSRETDNGMVFSTVNPNV
jgi:hypothetical protein